MAIELQEAWLISIDKGVQGTGTAGQSTIINQPETNLRGSRCFTTFKVANSTSGVTPDRSYHFCVNRTDDMQRGKSPASKTRLQRHSGGSSHPESFAKNRERRDSTGDPLVYCISASVKQLAAASCLNPCIVRSSEPSFIQRSACAHSSASISQTHQRPPKGARAGAS